MKKPPTKQTTAPAQTPRLIDRLWVRLVVALWIVGMVGYYYREQLTRVLQAMGR